MKRTFWIVGTLLAVGICRADNWPQWRGPRGDGVSEEKGLPIQWSETQNVLWKCPLPGEGASTPAIWNTSLFVTCQQKEDLLLVKLNTETGTLEWSQRAGAGTTHREYVMPREPEDFRGQKFHRLHNLASPSPVTDGTIVVAHFGNGDLAAFDFAGKKQWQHSLQKEHGTYTIWWGHANSPVLYKDLVITVCMQDSTPNQRGIPAESYLIAHDKQTGEPRWKTNRKTAAKAEECDSYTTPILHETPHGTELIVMGGNQLDAYDPATGKQLWYLPGLIGGRTITGPTLFGDLVYATQGMRRTLSAVRLGKKGQLSSQDVVWKEDQGTPDSPCPVAYNGLLFWITDNGIAQCRDARTGEMKWKERLAGDYKASPFVAEGHVYFLNLAGLCTVVSAAPKYEKLAQNQLPGETIASPAAANGRLFIRSRQMVYCLGTK